MKKSDGISMGYAYKGLFLAVLGLLFTGLQTGAHGQNLQFSRVVLKQGLGSVADTVPAGKVWKIEHVSCNSPSKGAYYLGINGQVYELYNEYSSGSSGYHAYIGPEGPIWLPAGTILQGGNGALTYTFSIIEFSVVP